MCACLRNHRTCALHHAYERLRLPRTPISMLLYMVGQVDTGHGACNVGCRQGKLAFRSTLKSGVRGWFSKVEFLPTTRGRSGEREQGVREVSSYDIRHPSQPARPLAEPGNQSSQSSSQSSQPRQPSQPTCPANPASGQVVPAGQSGNPAKLASQAALLGMSVNVEIRGAGVVLESRVVLPPTWASRERKVSPCDVRSQKQAQQWSAQGFLLQHEIPSPASR